MKEKLMPEFENCTCGNDKIRVVKINKVYQDKLFRTLWREERTEVRCFVCGLNQGHQWRDETSFFAGIPIGVFSEFCTSLWCLVS